VKATPSITDLLQEKLKIKRAQVYNRASVIADSLSVSTGDGLLVLAAQEKINLHKHGYPPAKVEKIRGLVALAPVPGKIPAIETSVGPRRSKLKAARPKPAFRVKLQKSATEDPLLSPAVLNDVKAMVQVYETLYRLENSIRVFITRVLSAKHGANWWDAVAPNGHKTRVQARTQDEEVNAWHQKRSRSPIDYLDLDQLPALVRNNQAAFVPAFFASAEWFQHFIEELYRSRCVGCHMNPLTQTNIDAVGVRFNQWQTLVKEKLAGLEQLEARFTPPTAPPSPAKTTVNTTATAKLVAPTDST
jgi:hypothetical protein